jgi:hypothetical protein
MGDPIRRCGILGRGMFIASVIKHIFISITRCRCGLPKNIGSNDIDPNLNNLSASQTYTFLRLVCREHYIKNVEAQYVNLIYINNSPRSYLRHETPFRLSITFYCINTPCLHCNWMRKYDISIFSFRNSKFDIILSR